MSVEIRLKRIATNSHHVHWNAMELSDELRGIMEEGKMSVSELAEATNLPQPMVSRWLGLQRLCPEVRAMLQAGELAGEAAYVISQEPDPEKQKALAAKGLSRAALRREVKRKAGDEAKEVRVGVARFALEGGATVMVQGKEMSLSTAIDTLVRAVKELRQAERQGISIASQVRVMKDRARNGDSK